MQVHPAEIAGGSLLHGPHSSFPRKKGQIWLESEGTAWMWAHWDKEGKNFKWNSPLSVSCLSHLGLYPQNVPGFSLGPADHFSFLPWNHKVEEETEAHIGNVTCSRLLIASQLVEELSCERRFPDYLLDQSFKNNQSDSALWALLSCFSVWWRCPPPVGPQCTLIRGFHTSSLFQTWP